VVAPLKIARIMITAGVIGRGYVEGSGVALRVYVIAGPRVQRLLQVFTSNNVSKPQLDKGLPTIVESTIVCSRKLQILRRGTVQGIRSCRGVIRSLPHSLSMADFIPDRTRPEN
jgi:hypothetical protein